MEATLSRRYVILVATTRVARFFLVRDTKLVNCTKWSKNVPNGQKMYQLVKKCTKWSKNVPNGHKIAQMSIKYFNIFQSKALKALPKL
jgi:hypothetical protein